MAITRGKNKTILAALCGTMALSGGALAQPPELSRGAIVASTCYACHGTFGVSPGSIPSFNEISTERMIDMLQGYRSGTRASSVMGRHASGYTNEEIVELAEYLGRMQKKGN